MVLSAAVALFAVVARVHNVTAYPAIHDWDASAHAVYVVDLFEGHLPNLRSWGGTHPPLYYALGAGLWALLPEAVPVHVMLRLISAGAWVATIGLVWRSLRRLGLGADAAVVAALLLGVPGLIIASSMMINDVLCAFFMTAVLVRLLEAPRGEVPPTRHVVLTSVLAGLAAMTKATGLAAVGMTAAFYAWQSRRSLLRAARAVSIVCVVTAAIIGPHYGRVLLFRPESPNERLGPKSPYHVPIYDQLAGFSGSPEKEAISLVVLAVMSANQALPSSGALLHDAIWGDPTNVFLPRDPTIPVGKLAMAGLVVAGLAGLGVVRLLVRRDIARRAGVVVTFGLLYGLALVPPSVVAPYMLLTKTNFLLPLILPAGLVLGVGLHGLRGHVRTALRGTLLIVAAGGVAVTWYGWWKTQPPAPSAVGLHDRSRTPPVVAVERYFRYRADDPVRALALLAPQLQLAHELRLVRILRIPFAPERGPLSEDARSLELARARQAWLELYNLIPWFQPIAAALNVTVLQVDQRRDTAEVQVRIGSAAATAPPAASGLDPWPFPDFEQRFTLRRLGGEWQITDIGQAGVSPENALPAFVAAPTLAGLEYLRVLGWRPDWEDALASAGRSAP